MYNYLNIILKRVAINIIINYYNINTYSCNRLYQILVISQRCCIENIKTKNLNNEKMLNRNISTFNGRWKSNKIMSKEMQMGKKGFLRKK